MPVRPQPRADALKEAGLLARRNVSEQEERHDRVERRRGDVELHCIRMHEARLGDVMARELDLYSGDVHTRHAVAPRELTCDWHPATAAELEHVGTVP